MAQAVVARRARKVRNVVRMRSAGGKGKAGARVREVVCVFVQVKSSSGGAVCVHAVGTGKIVVCKGNHVFKQLVHMGSHARRLEGGIHGSCQCGTKR